MHTYTIPPRPYSRLIQAANLSDFCAMIVINSFTMLIWTLLGVPFLCFFFISISSWKSGSLPNAPSSLQPSQAKGAFLPCLKCTKDKLWQVPQLLLIIEAPQSFSFLTFKNQNNTEIKKKIQKQLLWISCHPVPLH